MRFFSLSISSKIMRSGEGNGNPLHYSCLGNPTDKGAWQGTVAKEPDMS